MAAFQTRRQTGRSSMPIRPHVGSSDTRSTSSERSAAAGSSTYPTRGSVRRWSSIWRPATFRGSSRCGARTAVGFSPPSLQPSTSTAAGSNGPASSCGISRSRPSGKRRGRRQRRAQSGARPRCGRFRGAPICCSCERIRDGERVWEQLESYIEAVPRCSSVTASAQRATSTRSAHNWSSSGEGPHGPPSLARQRRTKAEQDGAGAWPGSRRIANGGTSPFRPTRGLGTRLPSPQT